MSVSKYVELVKEGKVYEATQMLKQLLTVKARQVVLDEMNTVAEAYGMKKESEDKDEDEEDESDDEEKSEDEDSEDEEKEKKE